MKIVADENIPLLDEFFSELGELIKLPGRQISAVNLKDADVLLTRSVTKVNAQLLENATKIKLVASATAGIEHVDTAYLQQRGIKFFNAPGANAKSVVEYVISSLAYVSQKYGFLLKDKTLGIVGLGNIGKELKKVCDELGINILINDPPLEKSYREDELEFVDLDYLIANSDIISLHVPLTRDCEYPTYKLFNKNHIDKLKPNSVLINTSRGGVVDELALKQRQKAFNDLILVLDVFESEPDIDAELVNLAELATPHIAGYSLDAKFKATEMLYKNLVKFFGLPTRIKLGGLMPEPWLKSITIAPDAEPLWSARQLIRSAYDVRDDDMALRLVLQNKEVGGFDRLRKNYYPRREFSQIKVKLRKSNLELRTLIDAMEFKLSKD